MLGEGRGVVGHNEVIEAVAAVEAAATRDGDRDDDATTAASKEQHW